MRRVFTLRFLVILFLSSTLPFLFVGCGDAGDSQGENEGQEMEVQRPSWPLPAEAFNLTLSSSEVERSGQRIEGEVQLSDVSLFQQEPHLEGLAPLVIVAEVQDPETAKFENGMATLEHEVKLNEVSEDGQYAFEFALLGERAGPVGGVTLLWKWPVLTEGCCSIALLSIVAGCENDPTCVCRTMRNMPAPGKWCCQAHPKMYRHYWNQYSCTGASPY